MALLLYTADITCLLLVPYYILKYFILLLNGWVVMTAFYIKNVNNMLRETMRSFIIRCFWFFPCSSANVCCLLSYSLFFPEHLDKSGIVIHTDVQKHQLKKQISSWDLFSCSWVLKSFAAAVFCLYVCDSLGLGMNEPLTFLMCNIY